MRGWERLLRAGRPAPFFFARRFVLCLTLCCAAGLCLGRTSGYAPWLWLFPVSLLAAAWLLRCFLPVCRLALCGALFSLGLTLCAQALHAPALPPLGTWTVHGLVEGTVSRSENGIWFFLTDVQVQPDGEEDWTPLEGRLYCYYSTQSASDLVHGQQVSVQGRVYLPDSPRNPGAFDQRMWLAQYGAHVRMYAFRAPHVEADAKRSLRGMALQINQALGERMDEQFGGASSLVRAMLLGDQEQVPEVWTEWMRDSGIAHLLAVSGLHVGFWYVLLRAGLARLPVSPRTRWVLLALLLGGYALLTGLKTSVLRASLMLLFVQGGRVLGRRSDPVTSLSLAALVLMLLRPLSPFSAGFQLSFCAVLGLVLLGRPMERLLRFLPKSVSSPLSATLSAQIGVLIPSAAMFGTVSIVSLLTNLVAIPLCGLLIPVAALATLLGALAPPIAFAAALPVRGMAVVLVRLSSLAAGVPWATLRLPAPAWWTTAALYGAMFLCSTAVVWRWRWRLCAIAGLLAAAVATGVLLTPGSPRYVQLDVGQALSGVLHVGAHCYVYDCGEENSDLTEYLFHEGENVDALFLSHPHDDHTGGLTELLEEGVRVDTLYVPANAMAFGGESEYENRLTLAASQGTRIVELATGDRLELAGATVEVLAPEREAAQGADPNDRSLVLLFEINGHRLLLCGDADGVTEPHDVDCDVLQVAHHGSKRAADARMLREASPDIALISVGNNYYGHPDANTVSRLQDSGAQVYTTQESGALTVYFTDDGLNVEAYCP